MRLLFFLVGLCFCAVQAKAQVLFYGGDTRYEGGLNCERNTSTPSALTYDDFDVPVSTTVSGVWANIVLIGFIPKTAYYEIREGVSEHDGGSLLASGVVPVAVFRTGRLVLDFYTEYQIRVLIPPIVLAPRRYFVTLAPIGYGYGSAYLNVTLGQDEGPTWDPNPPPTGTPIHNGNSFFDSSTHGFNFVDASEVMGQGIWDFSVGIGKLTTVAPALLLPDSFSVTRGVLKSGALTDLFGTDNSRVAVEERVPATIAGPSAQLSAEVFGTVPTNQNGNRVILTIESRCTAIPVANVTEQIEMYDFSQKRWVVVSQRSASSTDRQTVVTRTGQYVEPGTNKLSARVSWFDRGTASLSWNGEVDWIMWEVNP